MTKSACYCGHRKLEHYVPPMDTPSGARYCGPFDGRFCGCEGYQRPIQGPEISGRLVFGRDRQPRAAAETAPAWTVEEEP